MTPADLPEARAEHSTPRDPVDELADAVLAVPGVTGLHGGLLGEVATYLPGRRVAGIVLDADVGEIHIVADMSSDLQTVAATVRDTAERIAGRPFAVVVEDIAIDPTPTPKEGDAQ
ncbi:Asp23/Gls24 family envelope stress response protein [Gordonia westfalica]|uniref:Asp23/Gls24 family envelope stress response protein n=1 Tax=Gordonia westfalica TaxID=158898 RepID=A0ABU2GXE2_9ACTN|nr:Asp23/Gls24 family envelope stress response protein [Gordonia westfalica]MDS1115639.1 Asp23/Gls24 family envelope stress response protein [Gordonia westfalica]